MTACPACSEPAPDGAAWCEACGTDLAASPAEVAPVWTHPCVACDAPANDITGDGYCQQCGQRQPSPRDHQVIDLGSIAGVSDKGRKHHRNEDAMALELAESENSAESGNTESGNTESGNTELGDTGLGDTEPGVAPAASPSVLVVCDGVSSTELPDEASAAAATAAVDQLIDSAGDAAAFAAATAAAKAKVSEVWRSSQQAGDPPSCTFVGVAVRETADKVEATVGWLGDSRAYWLGTDAPVLLTRDHSWAEAQRELGELDEAAIESDPRAHSITRWIGIDAGDVTPEVTSHTFDRPGMLVVCSDGLWNYAPEPDELAAVVADCSEAGASTSVELAEALVAFANESGGHDNITVVIARFDTGE